MSLLHAGYPQQPSVNFSHHRSSGNNDPSRCASYQSANMIGGGVAIGDEQRNMMRALSRRDSDLSSNGSFENMSRPAYTGRDTDRFFGGGEFELDDDFGVAPTHDDDGEFIEDEDEPVSELVPLRGGTLRVPRTPKRKSVTKCGFYDFYKLTDEHLGSGAYGSVTTCTNIASGLEYAVKIVDKEGETHSRQRILREVNIFKTCKNHPNIVQLVDWFEDEDNFYLVMEKMKGGPLLQHILQRGYFTEEEARRVTKDIASALKFMHDRGIAHRDVKPENVLCTNPDRVSPVKLCDLDLASQRNPDRHERQLSQVASEPDLASPVGSAEFMAPEVVDAFVGDALKYDKKCDTWSLGVILYIMLAGYAPFQGECDDENCGWSDGMPCDDCQQELFHRIQSGHYTFPVEEWGMISAEAKDLVSNLLKRDPTDRFSADQILSHSWIQQSAPATVLQTPSNLTYRKDSARDVQQMSEHFNVMNRMVAARLSARMDQLSINEASENVNNNNGNCRSFLFGTDSFGDMSRSATQPIKRSDDYTPPVSRASPTTPPPSLHRDNGTFSFYPPNDGLKRPMCFGEQSVQLFGCGVTDQPNSIQMTPRRTAEDESLPSTFSTNSSSKNSSIGENQSKPAPIVCLETQVNV